MNLKKWQIIVTIICLILGTNLHFTYEMSNYNPIVGLFSAVNESVWEHLKLLAFPMMLMALIGVMTVKKQSKNYWLSQVVGIVTAISFVIIFFYTYTGIIGKNIAVLDIGSFIIGIILGEYVTFKIFKIENQFKAEIPSIILIILILMLFIVFTFYPPIIPLFEDPIFGTFGLEPKRID